MAFIQTSKLDISVYQQRQGKLLKARIKSEAIFRKNLKGRKIEN